MRYQVPIQYDNDAEKDATLRYMITIYFNWIKWGCMAQSIGSMKLKLCPLGLFDGTQRHLELASSIKQNPQNYPFIMMEINMKLVQMLKCSLCVGRWVQLSKRIQTEFKGFQEIIFNSVHLVKYDVGVRNVIKKILFLEMKK